MSVSDPGWLDLTTASGLLARGEIRATELVDLMLARIGRLNPALNAYVTVLADAARTEAAAADAEISRGQRRGPLHGVTVAVKDIIDVAGAPTTGGSRTLGTHGAARDAACVARLREAGAIVLGKLHTHELAGGVTSENALHGRARNPWNPDYIPGGSSGGAGIATAAGLAHGTLGTDTGGSVRIPAAFCGVVGLKPTYGRVSRRGVLARSWTMDHVGTFGRRVRDAALVFEAIAGHDAEDPYSSPRGAPEVTGTLGAGVRGLRAGVLAGAFFDDGLDPQIAAAFGHAVRTLESLGMTVKRVAFEHAAAAHAAGTLITLAEAASTQDETLRSRPEDFGVDLRDQLRLGEFVSARQYLRALRIRPLVQRELESLLREVDVLLTPTTSALPTRSDGATTPESIVLFARNTRPFSMAGVPALTVPCGMAAEGLPIGLQIVGRPLDEATLLRVGHAYELATAWHTLMPPGTH